MLPLPHSLIATGQSLLLPLLFLAVASQTQLAQGVQVSPTNIPELNWPEFRGPTADGKTGLKIPDTIDQTNVKWETPIHGKGWSSPVVWSDQIWLTTATEDGTKMSALCVDATSGEVVRDVLIHENKDPDFCHPTNSYATPTPAIEQGRVYLHFGSYGTTCLDTETGETIWQRSDLPCDHHRGPASSPILFENMLIVAFDGYDVQYVVALDKTTGETIWKTDREIKYGTDNGDRKKAYGTGAIFNVEGQPILVYPSAVATIAYQPRSGTPVWTVYHGGMNASARPVQGENGMVVISNGMGTIVAVDPVEGSDAAERDVIWKQTKGAANKPSVVVNDKHLYMINDKGIASCLDLKTGTPTWQKRVGGAFAASPICDGEKILALSEKGDVVIFEASNEAFELISKTKLGDGFKASPAVAGDRLILRSFSKLYSIAP